MPILTPSQWDDFLEHHPDAHLLQSSAWGEFKSAFGWRPVRLQSGTCGAQVLFRDLPLGLSLAYIPKGPIGTDWHDLWREVDVLCRQERAIALIVEPDAWEPATSGLLEDLRDFLPARPIQPRRTIEVSLEGDEETWLGRMKQKTRYNIRLAQRKGVCVRLATSLDAFYALLQTTSGRDRFGVHARAYYQRAFDLFAPQDRCALLMAEFEGQPLAGLMAFASGKRAWYFYGASASEERNLMPTYLLQFEAMRWAKLQGCTLYDLWGVPDADESQLEADFAKRSDGLWGVYRFKRGFGGQLVRSVGAFERPYIQSLYALYRLYNRLRGEQP